MITSKQSGELTVDQAYLSWKDFIVNDMLGAHRVDVTPVKMELLQFILVVQRSTFNSCPSTFQQYLIQTAQLDSLFQSRSLKTHS